MDNYVFFSQPIVNTKTSVIIKAELLLRENTANGWQLPDSFDLSVEDTMQLLDQAVEKLSVEIVGINLTNNQFTNQSFADALIIYASLHQEILLTVELTETPSVDDIKYYGRQYRNAGLRLFIDDVGTDNLVVDVKKELDYIDGLKLAMQNLRHNGISNRDELYDQIAELYQICTEHKLLCTLEGIEDITDDQFAKKLGVDMAQGYFYGEPLQP